MNRTPGYLLMSEFPNKETAVKKLQEIDKAAGFIPLDETLLHSATQEEIDDFLAHHGIKAR